MYVCLMLCSPCLKCNLATDFSLINYETTKDKCMKSFNEKTCLLKMIFLVVKLWAAQPFECSQLNHFNTNSSTISMQHFLL